MALNKITVDSIASNTITAAVIADGTVIAADIADGSITGPKLGPGAISSNNIPAGSVTGDKIGQSAVSANNIASNSIETYMATSGRPFSNRNIIINGAMEVAQRNVTFSGITTNQSGYYTADRWRLQVSSSVGIWTMNVESSTSGFSTTGFSNSANLICTTNQGTFNTGEELVLQQRIEGSNLQEIKKGTANAESVTVSFWTKSSNTGTYICELLDNANNRQISKTYTINTAGAWEKKTVTFPPDTTGQITANNALGVTLNFWALAGSDFTSGTLNSSAWATTVNVNRAVGQTNLGSQAGNYLAITGVQMETGTVATPFERRPLVTELALCQRYHMRYKNYDILAAGYITSTTTATVIFHLPVTLRASPSSSLDINNFSQITLDHGANATALSANPTTSGVGAAVMPVYCTVASGLTLGQGCVISGMGGAGGFPDAFIGFDAEL